MTEQKKPQAGEFWLTRGGERRYVAAVLPDLVGTHWPVVSVCKDIDYQTHTTDGYADDDEHKCDDDLVTHLHWCTSFDDAEPVAEYASTIEVNPGDGYRWLEDNEIVQSTDEVFRPDLTPCWVPPLTRAGKTVKHFDPDDYPVRRKQNPPAPTCPDCSEPITDGHADVCPMAWVVQDRVPARPGIDERAWQWKDGCTMDWVDARVMLADQKPKHGHQSGCRGPILHLRCRRKDLPPLPTPEPSTPDPGEGFVWVAMGDNLRPGDQWKDQQGTWRNAICVGGTVLESHWYRRRITPAPPCICPQPGIVDLKCREHGLPDLGPGFSEPDTVPVRLFGITQYLDKRGMALLVVPADCGPPEGREPHEWSEVLIVGNELRVRKAVQE